MRPSDLLPLLSLLRSGSDPSWTVRSLADELHLPPAAVQRSLARLRPDGQHGDWGVPEHVLCDRAQKRLSQTAAAVSSEDNQVYVPLPDKFQNASRNLAFEKVDLEIVSHPAGVTSLYVSLQVVQVAASGILSRDIYLRPGE